MLGIETIGALLLAVIGALWGWLQRSKRQNAELEAEGQKQRAEQAERREQEQRAIAETAQVEAEDALDRMSRGEG